MGSNCSNNCGACYKNPAIEIVVHFKLRFRKQINTYCLKSIIMIHQVVQKLFYHRISMI